jgi:hypothetical protein
MGSQPEQDVTVTATIKVAAFIYSSHSSRGGQNFNSMEQITATERQLILCAFQRISAKHLLFIYVTISK